MQQYKIVPILAHPERYAFMQKEPELLYDLVEKGVLLQANYGSIIGQYGKKPQNLVRKMFENNLVHFHKINLNSNLIYKYKNQTDHIIIKHKSLKKALSLFSACAPAHPHKSSSIYTKYLLFFICFLLIKYWFYVKERSRV